MSTNPEVTSTNPKHLSRSGCRKCSQLWEQGGDSRTRPHAAPPGDTLPWSTAGTRSECHKALGPRNEVEEMDACAGTVPQKPKRPRGRPGSAGTSRCCFLNTQPRQESNRTRPLLLSRFLLKQRRARVLSLAKERKEQLNALT